ncbi:hypothetical protein C0993_008341 [Termitomyces sp. T159_Od127]|nr:hypothetical protein C0993_008341 [Termitomyces sp. T159_Od127]
MGNLDIALLDRENAVSTHVTPLIASLAQGLVSEELVVVGIRPPPENRTLKENQRLAAHERLCELILKAKGERKAVKRIGRDSRYPTIVEINGEPFQNGDFVVIPRNHGSHKGYYKPSDLLPDSIEDVDPTSTIADYFWFAQIVYCCMNPSPGHFHVHWLQHSAQTMLEELGHTQELFWNDICENVPLGAVVDKIKVYESSKPPGNPDEYFVKFVYDANQATYTSSVLERRELVASSRPPFNCTICYLLEQQDQEKAENKLRDEKGTMNGVAFRGEKYHFEDFVLYHAQQGPAHLGYIVDLRIISNKRVQSEVYLRRVGRISLLGDVLPDDVLKDEVRPSDLGVCAPCTEGALERLKDLEDFLEDTERRPLKTLDIFGGVGAFSMGLCEGSGCLEVTDVVELAPSAAKTVM